MVVLKYIRVKSCKFLFVDEVWKKLFNVEAYKKLEKSKVEIDEFHSRFKKSDVIQPDILVESARIYPLVNKSELKNC